ncbi:MAG: cobalt ECF transporter T component CbiQ [Actinobacteria bacterium]|nr:cobalt ECF transporter T component CbiQ [Actinomycetota bacterium]
MAGGHVEGRVGGVGHLVVHGHSPVHRLAPEAKVVATFAFVICVALTPREQIWAFGVHAAVAISIVALAGVPTRVLLARLAVIIPFLTFAVLVPFVAGGEEVDVLGVGLSRDGLWGAWNVAAKASIGATASIILSATTSVPEILKALTRLRVPRVLVSIMSFMMRYLDLLVDQLGRMRTSMTARCHDPRWLWQAKPIASSAGALFVRSYERGERVHQAMLSRGFSGTMPDTEERATPGADWARAALPPVVALAALLSAVVL